MSKRTVLVVDLQNDYLPTGQFPLVGIEPAIDNAARVIADARAKGDKVVHVRHEFPGADAPFFAPGTDGAQIHSSLEPAGDENWEGRRVGKRWVSSGRSRWVPYVTK